MLYNKLDGSIKIFISYHNKSINQIGTSIVQMIPTDVDVGTNIANKENYCELRTQYYIWKNGIPEYVGFFQFRRYLDLSKKIYNVDCYKKPCPYIIRNSPNIENISLQKILYLKKHYDVIAPIPEYNGISVYKRYIKSDGHRKKDLDMIVSILLDKYPHFSEAAELYLNGVNEYYGNMFFMKKQVFEEYCSWLFDILFTFDREAADVLPNTNGYLGERLFGIYFTYLKLNNNLSLGEVPRIHFSCYDDSRHKLKKQKIINAFFPPGSKLRGIIRKISYLGRKK
jgi:hypothetical protein